MADYDQRAVHRDGESGRSHRERGVGRLGHQRHHRVANRRGRAPAAPGGTHQRISPGTGSTSSRSRSVNPSRSRRATSASRGSRSPIMAGDDLRLRDELHDHVRPGDHDGRSRDGDASAMRGSRRTPGGSTSCRATSNDDGVVNAQDLIVVRNDFTASARPYNIFDDINGDGVVDINDTNVVGRFMGKKLPITAPDPAVGASDIIPNRSHPSHHPPDPRRSGLRYRIGRDVAVRVN